MVKSTQEAYNQLLDEIQMVSFKLTNCKDYDWDKGEFDATVNYVKGLETALSFFNGTGMKYKT